MGVHHAANGREGAVQLQVRGQVRRRLALALQHAAVRVHHHHVVGRHLFVRQAAGLDDDGATGRVTCADIAPGEGHQPQAGQFQVGVQHLLLHVLQVQVLRVHA
jgi:hypothetical protein